MVRSDLILASARIGSFWDALGWARMGSFVILVLDIVATRNRPIEYLSKIFAVLWKCFHDAFLHEDLSDANVILVARSLSRTLKQRRGLQQRHHQYQCAPRDAPN